ncbi:hypothetical protein K2Z83_26325 [Oscillochloris sp. ZM17-4]|uniref:hypothetical protein n=1 Tax=Oscillochloris sp. ZM17-4 TaxID=2866714 RepID=UPI001C737289|nr:hypothetical protein [Oscillochloris sp. ZM17-4]MBX0331170.1 hypothetical protein [Oscillochloris sp. ZM17-4]
MADGKKLIKVPQLRKKGRSLVELGPDSLGAALHWDKLAGELADQVPADQVQPVEPVEPVQPVEPKERRAL